MNKVLKTCIRLGIFLIIFLLIFAYLSAVFFPKWKNVDDTKPGIETFYAQPQNSIDVLFLGTSSFRNGFSPMTIWEETGITSYLRATAGQLPLVSYYYLLEALEYQQPKVVVLEGASLFSNTDVDKNESAIRKSVDPMRLSRIKLKLIRDVVSASKNQTFDSYIFPLLRYHDRWKELERLDFEYRQIDQYDPFRGQYITRGRKPLPEYSGLEEKIEKTETYDAEALYYYQKIVQLCKEKHIEVVLVTLPRMKNFSYAEHVGIQQFADQYGLRYVDYNMPELLTSVGIKSSLDYQNTTHLNVYGSQKISLDFSAMLKSEFAIADKRDDPAYLKWNEDQQIFQREINLN